MTQTPRREGLPGIFAYYYLPLRLSRKYQQLAVPQSVSQFPLPVILYHLISNLLKLALPFALQFLYLAITPQHILVPILKFVTIVVLAYYFDVRAEAVLNDHKLQVKRVLCERVIRTAMRAPFQELQAKKPESARSSWSKISSNINIFVYNYYSSYLTLIFETLKAMFIVVYLFTKLGWVTLVGLMIGGLITQFIGYLSKNIENANFNKLRVTELKTKILTQYFSKIIDYQMSWLDGFIGDRVEKLEDEYQRNLRKVKLLDAWCVGLWQFTQIGISSVVLCLYYFHYSGDTTADQLQPATIIYLFQMLTFPMNAISWNIAGLNNAERAARQMADSQRIAQVDIKRQKYVERFQYGYEITHLENNIKQGKFYALYSEDPKALRKLALSVSKQGKKVGYAQENGFFLPTAIQNLYMLPSQIIDSAWLKRDKQKLIKALQLAKCEEIPLENLTQTFSGGQKMRISLARAFFNGDLIVIDSDLFSLDKSTRGKVMKNIRDYTIRNGITVVMRGKKGDQEIDRSVHEYVTVQSKFLRLSFEQSKSQKSNMKKSVYEPQKQAAQQYRIMEQKVQQEISKLQTNQIFHPSYSQLPRQSQSPIPKQLARKLKLTWGTLKFYYHHKFSHVLFVVSLAAMYAVGNYYNYFVNVSKPDDPSSYAYTIMNITVLYIVFIVLRSYLFARANLKQSWRICQLTNKLMIYNHISFYAKHNIIERNPEVEDLRRQSWDEDSNSEEEESKPGDQEKQHSKNMNTEKLVCLSTSDQITINNQFPFSTNILWNNIATVIGSLVMIFMEVPLMAVFLLVFVFSIQKIEKAYREFSEQLVVEAKDQEVRLMRAVNNIEQGALYLHVYGRQRQFVQIFTNQLCENIENSNKQSKLSTWVQYNFRFNMILFLVISVALFWANLAFLRTEAQPSVSATQTAKLGVMLRYILLLADYVFYLTRSLAECRGKAISIERVKRFVQNLSVIKGSFQRLQRSNHKIEAFKKQIQENEVNMNRQYINLTNFNYQYERKGPNVLENINLRIRSKDRIVLKGKTGSGKTTLFKILMGLYPEVYFPESSMHLISFSSQLPLKMAECSVLQKIDPYQIMDMVPPLIRNRIMERARKIVQKYQKSNSLENEDQVLINNLRAYLYGYRGLAVYDEPQLIVDENSTYIVVTHHGKFKNNHSFKLERGRITELSEQERDKQYF